MEELSAAQVVVVGLDLRGGCRCLLDGAFLGVRKHHAQCAHDVIRDLVLDREHVFQLPIVAFGPEMVAVRDAD
jgi:hypothetical protein